MNVTTTFVTRSSAVAPVIWNSSTSQRSITPALFQFAMGVNCGFFPSKMSAMAVPSATSNRAEASRCSLSRPAKRVVRFYHQRGTAEQWIKEGKNAVKWTRLSGHDFVDNQVRLQLFVLAYNLGNFLRQAVLPDRKSTRLNS